jgi:hypothetical protein
MKKIKIFVLLLFIFSCKPTSNVLEYDYSYFCNGNYPYSKDKSKSIYYSSGALNLDAKNFSIEYDFTSTEYREQNPIMLGRSSRVLGLLLTEEGSSFLTINNNKRKFKLDFKYEIDKSYHVKIIYQEGITKIIIDDKLYRTVYNMPLYPEFPTRDYLLTSCNFSSGKCFIGYLKNIKVKNIAPLPDESKKPSESKLIKKAVSFNFIPNNYILTATGKGVIDVYSDKLEIKINEGIIKINPRSKKHKKASIYSLTLGITKLNKKNTFNGFDFIARSEKIIIKKDLHSQNENFDISNLKFNISNTKIEELKNCRITLSISVKERGGVCWSHSSDGKSSLFDFLDSN